MADEAFWKLKAREAVSLRRDVLRLDETTDAYRVLHGESDGTPGLVVDRYGDCLSAEVFSLGMSKRCEPILEMLAAELGTKHYLVQECHNSSVKKAALSPTDNPRFAARGDDHGKRREV